MNKKTSLLPTIILFGPTGVGKSKLADDIAHVIPSEIINMDVGQLYKPFSIGTAKPELKNISVVHHLFDIIDEPKDFTVTQYRNQVEKIIQECKKRGNVPIIVGGSGFYLKSLFFPPTGQPIDESQQNVEKTWQKLYEVDKKRALQIHPHDQYRINRALDIWYQTGKKPSEFKPAFKPLGEFILMYVTRDRKELYDRINKRVIAMMEQGWIDEVKNIDGTEWVTFLKRKKLIGYNDIIDYLEKVLSQKELITTIQKKTRNYAKRQNTFWNMLKKEIEKAQKHNKNLVEINLTTDNNEVYIKQLLNKLKTF